MARKTYTPEQKAEAMGRVLAGETISGVARDLGIERITLQQWMAREKDTVTAVVTADPDRDLKAYLHEYLSENLITQTAHARLYRDPEWIAQQPPETIMAIDRQLGSRFVSIMDRLDGRSRESDDHSDAE